MGYSITQGKTDYSRNDRQLLLAGQNAKAESSLQVPRLKSGLLSNLRQNDGTYLLGLVKRKRN